MARLAMLIDLTRCIGCDACTVACKQENGTPADVFFARVLNVEAGSYPNVKRVYLPVLCNHCENPACLKACPNKAIYKRDDGIVLIDQDRCRGTGACVSACPYGNIILKSEDHWYLPEDRPYERDFVKPRLKQNVARKCTLCAQRVDRGLEPACVVACPTTGRIFGDLEDPSSKISTYVREQRELTGRDPFKLVPEAGTQPANMYLPTMAVQESSTLASPAPSRNGTEAVARKGSLAGAAVRAITVLLAAALFMLGGRAAAQQAPVATPGAQVWASSTCAGCHGKSAAGDFGPALVHTKLTREQFGGIVRKGKGMMPAVPVKEVSDAQLDQIYGFVAATKAGPVKTPLSAKIAGYLTPHTLAIGFSVVGTLSLILMLRTLLWWLNCAAWKELRPSVARYGYGRAAWIMLRSVVVDGLLVASVWRKDKFRWSMHALLIYGFLAIGLADLLISIFNPTRAGLPLTHPLRLLPNIGGVLAVAGLVYVLIRYRRDPYIDNGLTKGRDLFFVNLLLVTILTGLVVEIFRHGGPAQWVMPAYVVHLALVAVLFLTAPFTRFQHVFVVPMMVAMTRLTSEIAASGAEPAFLNEPCPGRDHKSRRIVHGALGTLAPEHADNFRLRYYP